ncbi:hypothetical protein [Paenibacillus ehimensis]|uniref:hypothetical protein n=1 Tax=Paenibacillus ehimensis TaxID=79264 RepID=UPI00046FEC19|nr:hypothetical protein [Paenibacillus ehimensis]
MSRVCEHHQEKPVRVYNQCIGCELKSLHTDIERLTKERDAFKVGRDNEMILKNEVIRQYEKLEAANTAMREALEQLIEVYERRQRSAITILDDPDTSKDQWIRVQGKKEVFRVSLLELDTILKGEDGHGHGKIETDQ